MLNHNLSKSLYLLAFCLICSCKTTQIFQGYPVSKQSIADNAMIVTAHPLATKAGIEILKKGGNAIDAAVAVQFTLAVVYPVAGNIGGGGFMIYRDQKGEKYALDFREKAPGKASKNMYLDTMGQVIPGLSINGHLAAGVPGSVEGMWQAHKKFGTIKFSELLEPAIKYARQGFNLTENQANLLNQFQERFKQYNLHQPVFLNNQAWKKGDLLIQPDLAKTLQLIAQNGRSGFYEGQVAQQIVAEMKKGGGIISLEDLKNYNAVWREPVKVNYRDHDIYSMPPPSSGGVALAQLFKSINPYPIQKMGHLNPQTIHLMVEAERRVYADRAMHMGDKDFYPVPMDTLLSDEYIMDRMHNFNSKTITPSKLVRAGYFGLDQGKESEQTTHFSIVDKEGRAVSITTTINSAYGSKTVVEGAGFLLNNEMDDFSAKPGSPNYYGLIGAAANAIEPGKRMLSSMTPTIVEKDNQLFMVVGTPGGSTIITSVFQTIVNVIDHQMGMAEAVTAPRFHHQWKPDLLQHEKEAFPIETTVYLKKLGHELKDRGSIGKVDAILVLPNGQLEGGADPRGDDFAEGL